MKQNLIDNLSQVISTTGRNRQSALMARRLPVKAGGPRGILILLCLLLMACPVLGQTTQLIDSPTSLTIKSEVLGEERVILVRVPPGYERSSERFPVLYMTDGAAHLLHTSSTLAFLGRNGRIPEMILVSITNTDRTRDLTPTHTSLSIDNQTIQLPTSGGADKFLKFIETELIPYIESRYRTQPYRIFAGHSFGGLFSIYALLARPDLFNAHIAVSPSLPWDNQLLLKRAEELLKQRKEWKKALYLSLGNEPGDMTNSFNQFKQLLTKYQPKGFEWEAVIMDDEDHGSVVLRSHYAGLRKIFAGWQIPRDPNTGAIVGGLSGMEEHYKKLSQKFGFNIPVPEAYINQLGYQLLGAGKKEEAIAVFKTNVERYPNSANVYDSLAEAYEKSGRLDLARPNYDRAYTVGKERSDPNLALYKANLDRVVEKLKQGEVTAADK